MPDSKCIILSTYLLFDYIIGHLSNRVYVASYQTIDYSHLHKELHLIRFI